MQLGLVLVTLAALAGRARAEDHPVDELVVEGLDDTKREVIVDLVPRTLPAAFTDAELDELGRRIKNLGIFASVKTTLEDRKIRVAVSEKSTISPIIGFSSGKTLEDSSATLGVTEYNLFGGATRAGGKISYLERGLNFAAWIEQHTYSPNRWAKELEVYRFSSGFRFVDSPSTWLRNRTGGYLEFITPFRYGSRFLYELQLVSYVETFTNVEGDVGPESGLFIGGLFEIIYDAYRWDDLAPSGYKLVAELRPGAITTGKFRGEVRVKGNASLALTRQIALVWNANIAAVNPGDPNHSLLVGSQVGVRGLPDSLYRGAYVGYANTELRASARVYGRTFVQGVGFVDAALFRAMDREGELGGWVDAISAGVGLRVVPTGLTNLVLRVDAARLVRPDAAWFTQIGISQYF